MYRISNKRKVVSDRHFRRRVREHRDNFLNQLTDDSDSSLENFVVPGLTDVKFPSISSDIRSSCSKTR